MFGSLFSSRSSSDTRTDISERINTTYADGGSAYTNALGGITITGGDKKSSQNITNIVELTDHGALAGGMDLAAKAIDAHSAATAEIFNYAGDVTDALVDGQRRALDANLDVTREALDFAEDSQDQSFAFAGRALEESFFFADDAQKRSYDFAGAALGVVGDALSGFQQLAGDTVATASDALTRAFASTQGGDIDATRDMVKVVALAAVGVAGLMMLRR